MLKTILTTLFGETVDGTTPIPFCRTVNYTQPTFHSWFVQVRRGEEQRLIKRKTN